MVDDMEEIYVPCNLCGGAEYTVIYGKIMPHESVKITDRYSAAKGVLCTDQIVKCRCCGLVYINPRLKDKTIIDACSEGDDEVYISQADGRMLTFRKSFEWLEKYAKQRVRLLDVGCAAGFFLKVASDAGWDVVGVEPNKWLGQYGREKFGVEIFSGTLEEAAFPDNSFDVVTLWDVLEHMPNPRNSLNEVNRVLRNNGLLVISYPDYDSIFSKLLRRRWWFILSHHLYYFTPKTIDRILKETGFEVVTTKRHFQRLQVGYMLDMAIKLSGKNPAKILFKLAYKALKITRLDGLHVIYYAGQRDLIARKVKNVR